MPLHSIFADLEDKNGSQFLDKILGIRPMWRAASFLASWPKLMIVVLAGNYPIARLHYFSACCLQPCSADAAQQPPRLAVFHYSFFHNVASPFSIAVLFVCFGLFREGLNYPFQICIGKCGACRQLSNCTFTLFFSFNCALCFAQQGQSFH